MDVTVTARATAMGATGTTGPSIPAWIQAGTSVLSLVVVIFLAGITKSYAGDTKRMADEMVAERENRVKSLSWEAAARLADAFVEARSKAERSRWRYEELYLPLQPVIHRNVYSLRDLELRKRVNTANAMLGALAEDGVTNHRNKYGLPEQPWPSQASLRVVEGFKAVADDLIAYQLEEPIVPTARLPSADRVWDWLAAPPDAAVEDYQ